MCVCVCPLLRCVCVCVHLDGSIQRTHFTAGYTLYNYVCNKKNRFTKPITDYGKMLKYQQTDISVDL